MIRRSTTSSTSGLGALPLRGAAVGLGNITSISLMSSTGQIHVSRAPAAPFTIAPERADQPEVRALIDALDAYQLSLYPAESCFLLDIATLLQPDVRMLVVRDRSGQVLGCGAIVLRSEATGVYAEVKRMMVAPAARGLGLGRLLLEALEDAALREGASLLRLETGPRQPAAIGLYEAVGFARCGPFGDYADDPFSVFMEKRIGA